jgi:SAM-dependent methyltransferase
MLEVSRRRLLERLRDDEVVLDVGGWADPFPRADWVIDLMPYETRGLYEREGWIEPRDEGPERFSAATWIQRDVCDREPFPFADGQIDFAVCAHTLEDVRDPLWVCAEMVRVAKAGYVEVPSRLEEQSYGVEGDWVGWGHHRWLIEVDGDRIEFVHKNQSVQAEGNHFPVEFGRRLSDEERVETLWWEDGFEFAERTLIGPEAIGEHLSSYVAAHGRRRLTLRRRSR